MEPLVHYHQLVARVDSFFERVSSTHASDINCGPGCSDCCHSRFSVTAMEAQVIVQELAGLAPATRERLRQRAEAGDPARCAALDDQGLCEIFSVRPLICRSHGLPIRCSAPDDEAPPASSPVGERDASGRLHLQIIEVCPKNFQRGLDHVASSDMLDQTTVSTVLAAIDAVHCDSSGLSRGSRFDLAELLAQTW